MAELASAHWSCRIGLIGYGAIGRYLARALPEHGIRIKSALVRPHRMAHARDALGADIALCDSLPAFLDQDLDLVVECAGQEAVLSYAAPILRSGVDLAIISSGALANAEVYAELIAAAGHSRARILIPHGAVAGCEALSAARFGGLNEVIYTARKPALAWRCTPAEQVCDLSTLSSAREVYDGPARQAAQQFPQNANIAAIVALAGIGFDATRVRLIADPEVRHNTHRLTASGAFGEMDVQIAAHPFPENRKTSALAALSLVRTVRQRVDDLII